MSEWKRGLPPGKYYEGMENDFEVSFTVLGGKWHRRRTEEEKQAWIALKAGNAGPASELASHEGKST